MEIEPQQLVSILDSSASGVAIVNSQNNLVYSNQAFSGFN